MANIKYADPSYTAIPVPGANDYFMIRTNAGTDGRVPISALQAANLSGTYALRPAANTLRAGTIYYATDVLEQYVTNGTAWTVYGGAGVSRGYAETVTAFSVSSPTLVDVPGMSVTLVQGERPLLISWGASLRSISGGGTLSLTLTVAGTAASQVVYAGTAFQYAGRTMRLSTTPGASVTIKLQALVTSGTGQVYADSADRPFLLVVNS